jgi:enterochelin esterase-like enzyme
MRRWTVVLIAAAWLAVGLTAAYGYAHRYAVYRGFPPPTVPAGVSAGALRTVDFWSPSVQARSQYLVYLPPGYARAAARGRRYPVLYLLHGYPGKMSLWLHIDPVGVQADELIAQRRMPPMIMVMPAGKVGALGADTEWADTRAGGRWMSYVMDVVHDVDRRFATEPGRAHRGIAGPSEGGYGAVNIALRHLADFGVVEAWGGYFTQTPTAVYSGASPAQLRAASPADYLGTVAPRIRRLGLHAWLYQGRSDRLGTAALLRFSARLRAAGADVRTALFRGGHDWALFRAKTPRMLAAAARWMSPAPAAAKPAAR